ncbi:hypothetical protein T10_8695 [Trichinella papuae]|uniref:Uncharacterized protein n=1 Tax=Trichinella papuae TaxID=268474 RepID=A0A0V1N9A7_9BILA|nr:hypothetical protein T10_8695 [Trichinella papuae]
MNRLKRLCLQLLIVPPHGIGCSGIDGGGGMRNVDKRCRLLLMVLVFLDELQRLFPLNGALSCPSSSTGCSWSAVIGLGCSSSSLPSLHFKTTDSSKTVGLECHQENHNQLRKGYDEDQFQFLNQPMDLIVQSCNF